MFLLSSCGNRVSARPKEILQSQMMTVEVNLYDTGGSLSSWRGHYHALILLLYH